MAVKTSWWWKTSLSSSCQCFKRYVSITNFFTLMVNWHWHFTSTYAKNTFYINMFFSRHMHLRLTCDCHFNSLQKQFSGSGFSSMDPDSVDLLKYPDVAKVQWTYATLYPGDCIYIPSGILTYTITIFTTLWEVAGSIAIDLTAIISTLHFHLNYSSDSLWELGHVLENPKVASKYYVEISG